MNLPRDWLKEPHGVYHGYHERNYTGLSGILFRAAHRLLEKNISPATSYPTTLEIGAGFYSHHAFVKHHYQRYVISDTNPEAIEYQQQQLSDPRVECMLQRDNKLDLEEGSVDRIIASQVLEHIYPPQQVLAYWIKLLKPNGVLSIGLPCDPGLLWRMCRFARTCRMPKDDRLAYHYFMAKEHANAIGNLISMLSYHVPNLRIHWWPTPLPSTDINLFCAIHIKKSEFTHSDLLN